LTRHPQPIEWTLAVGVDQGDARDGLDHVAYHILPNHLYTNPESPKTGTLKTAWAINWLAQQQRDATHFWVINDDAETDDPDWARKIAATPPAHLGLTHVAGDPNEISVFPVVTIQHVRRFRTIFPRIMYGWGADVWLCLVYRQANAVHITDIHLRHTPSKPLEQAQIAAAAPIRPHLIPTARWSAAIRSLNAQKKRHGQSRADGPRNA
jgi:hypothetical protein